MAASGINTRTVRDLAKILADHDLTDIEIEHEGTRIIVSRAPAQTLVQPAAPVAAAAAPAAAAASAPAPVMAAQPTSEAAAEAADLSDAVRSPMVGTVYLQPEPGAASFIREGDTVSEGQQLFIIEAMKTMNPVAAPRSGVVRRILVSDSQPVEFGEPLCQIS